ncbi:MAG TPA: D-TA family PLP-dependent enzyme [Puia sp.]|nr:D-TA family PLP-dependent enzyme [Puia sp.]
MTGQPKDQQEKNWYSITDIDQLDTPVLVVYPDRVKKNIRLALEMVGGDPARLRPHVKTHKSPGATRLLLDAGITKFKCATIAEAEMLAISGAPDVLLAYQPVGPKLRRFISLIREYPATTFSCLIDNAGAAAEMDRSFSEAGLRVPVYIDLNLGMNRTGIAPGPAASELYLKYSERQPQDPVRPGADPANRSGISSEVRNGIFPVGLHAYDGHIRDTDMDKRTQRCDAAFEEVEKLSIGLTAQGVDAPLIVAGGSPTFSIHCKRKGIECSPGTFIYWDRGYCETCPEQHFLPAALVVTRVVSLPDSTKICLDLGHKSVAAENDLAHRVWFLDAEGLTPTSQSEEHLVMETSPAHGYPIGHIFYGLPYHICPTVALYERAITITGGKITGEWMNSARDRRIRS